VGDGPEGRGVSARPLISICVPTANRADFLRLSLPTIAAQDYEPLEILISDNASSDATEEIGRALAASDARVRYVRHPKNIGLYQNHNFCIEESRGEFFCFFHDDDTYTPSVVRQNAAVLLEHPEVGVVCSDWNLIDEKGELVGARRFPGRVVPGLSYVEQTIASGRSSICCPGALIRRSALGSVRFPESGPIGFGDFLVWFQVAEHAAIGHVPSTLWSYRQHPRALSRRTIESLITDFLENLETYFAGHLSRWPAEGARVARWRRLGERYAFWALVYELCLHARRTRGPLAPGAVRTIFELADYRLSREDLDRARAKLHRLQRGARQRVALFVVERLLDAGLTGPLAWASRQTERLRARLATP
jgi:glycosyltransferase involved in cell wall biosynthesis